VDDDPLCRHRLPGELLVSEARNLGPYLHVRGEPKTCTNRASSAASQDISPTSFALAARVLRQITELGKFLRWASSCAGCRSI
jgi:hypothetical protein